VNVARRNRRTANGNAPFDKASQNLARHDKVLIVCEDTKSSRFYIVDLVKHLHLQSARVLVIAGANSAPISVVNTAIKMAYPKNEDAFDRVFIIIDRDTHPTYDNALNKANHNLFGNTVEKMDIAFGNAQRSLKDATVDDEFNPSTAFSILISELTSIANPNAIDTILMKDIETIIKSAVNSAFELSLSQVVLGDKLFSALHPHLTSTSIYHHAVERFKNTSGLEVSVVDGVCRVAW
jgi:hypothetical protein